MQNSDAPPDTGSVAARNPGRPRAFDRVVALDRATRLFWSKGYEATSIADLTQAMGIGAPSLYAAFRSKEALYAEALRHYAETNEGYVWAGFGAAETAREAVRSLLMDSAAALTGCVVDIPRGCMVALSSVGSEGHAELGELVRSARAVTLERLSARFDRAVADGEIPASTNIHGLARFVQALQNGMSILARDGAMREELEAATDVAMAGWDAMTSGRDGDGRNVP
jgi:AcrR family transcriptional regulator